MQDCEREDSQAFRVTTSSPCGRGRLDCPPGFSRDPLRRWERFRAAGRVVLLVLLLAAPSLVAAGCGGDDISFPGNAPIRPTQPPATETPDEEA